MSFENRYEPQTALPLRFKIVIRLYGEVGYHAALSRLRARVRAPLESPFSSSLTGKRHTYNMKTQEHYLTDRVDNYY